jgi:uncharacterized RDD family membrane protein YckC
MSTTVSSKYAGLKIRLMAFLIDLIVVALPLIAVTLGLLYILKPSQELTAFIFTVLPLIFYIGYFAYGDKKGQTLGKKYTGIITYDLYKNNLSASKAVVRALIKVLLFFICWINIPGSKRKAGLHDLILKTQVYYMYEDEAASSDTDLRFDNFMRFSVVIYPIISAICILIIFIGKANPALASKESILLKIMYLIVPILFYSVTLGLTISIQALRYHFGSVSKNKAFVIINSFFVLFYIITIIKAFSRL